MTRDKIKIIAEDVRQILADTITDYEKRTGKTLQPAHIERSIIQSYSYRELLVRKGINEAFLQTFPQFATGLALDLCGEMMGTFRLKDQPARCILRFNVAGEHSEIVIPQNTQVQVNESLWFSTVSEMRIRAMEQYMDIDAIANLVGEQGNGWQPGQVKTLKTPLSVEVSVSNIDVTSGGIGVETDDDYRQRILLAPEAFTTCGSVAAYEYHARSVSQFIADVAIDTPQGGEVKITILTKQGLPSTSLINQVQAYLSPEKRRPLCDTVRVVAPHRIGYQIQANLDLLESYSETEVKQRAETALQTYLSSRTQKLGLDIVPLDIERVLKVNGVYNVTLTEPILTEVNTDQWAECEHFTININAERKNG